MATNVEIPEVGESISEVILVEWLKQDGDRVETDEPICVLETDKADVELPAPATGVLHTLKEEGDTIQVGEAIARIGDAEAEEAEEQAPAEEAEPEEAAQEEEKTEEGEEPAETEEAKEEKPIAKEEKATEGEKKREEKPLSPAVRRLVEEHDLDVSEIEGTGKGGRLTKADVLAHIEAQAEEQAPAEKEPVAAAPPKEEEVSFEAEGIKRVPMSKIRRRIAERLVAVQQTAAMLTTFNEIDMSAVMEVRSHHKERFAEVHGVSLGLTSFFARACVLALKDFPRLNASLDGEEIVYHQYVHLGIAVSTDRGLVVPVLRNVESMSLARIETEIKRMASAAREGKLGIPELSGGTFTITNGGIFGSLLSTPILNPPQSGILGMHAIQKRPVVVNDAVEIRPMMYVALTYDHRLVDGRESVSFLVRLKELIEDPVRLMLEI